jgi:PAS domain S-box-containing protein
MAEKALIKSEEKYRLIVDNTSDLVVLIDLQGNFIFMSKSIEKNTGYEDHELLGKNIKYILSPKSYTEAMKRIDLRIKGVKDLTNYEVEIIAKDNHSIPFELNTSPILNNGKLESILIVARDISERKESEIKLKESGDKYRTLFEDSKNPIWMTSREGIILDANQATAELLGYSKEELIGLDVYSLYVDPGHRKIFQAEIEEKGFVKNFQSQWKTKDGHQLDILFDFTLWKDNDEKIIGYRGIAEDVTLLNKSQKQLGENLEYFAHLVDHIRNPLTIICGFTQVEIENEKTKKRFLKQIGRIEEIIKQLDQGWMDTEDTRKFMKKYM